MSRIAFASLSVILLILTLLFFTPLSTAGDLGLCLLSPNQWNLPRFAGWFINAVLIFLSAFIFTSANKKYNFIQEATPVMGLAMLILLACNCISTAALTTSTLLLFTNVLCMYVILTTFEEQNATREFFVIATLPAIGAMFQYAFLWMIPVYIAAGFMMKSFRVKELIAFIFGLAAPYWIVFGLGIVPLDAFRTPDSLTVFNREAVNNEIFYSLLGVGIMAVIGFILSLYNSVRLFSRNSRLRCMHLCFNFMGYMAILATILDFNNFEAFSGTICLWLAIQTATLLNLYNIRHSTAALTILFIIFLPLYILML